MSQPGEKGKVYKYIYKKKSINEKIKITFLLLKVE